MRERIEMAMLEEKFARLSEILRECGSVCIGYSGGVDSVFLAKAALDVLGPENVLAVTGRSASYPEVQREMALDCVRRFGIPHLEIETDELADPNYAANPSNRCYFCKTELWSKLTAVAEQRGYAVVLDGSNADDVGDHRPGMRAAAEKRVRSPLLEAGLTKAEIRELSRRMGLPTWDRPAAPCLSSRLPYGLAVTPERLRQVEAAEEAMRGRGFREFRVRHHGDAARLEVAPVEMPRALELASDLVRELTALGFERVLLDVEGYRRGALNEAPPLVRLRAAAR
ncbi:MAG TPA: ATP-dependent sacrificial sulfur transferase LarE [Longimicrobiales bacterium]